MKSAIQVRDGLRGIGAHPKRAGFVMRRAKAVTFLFNELELGRVVVG